MKNPLHTLSGVLCVALFAAGGCGKKDETPSGASPTAKPSAGGAVEKAVATSQAQTEVVKPKSTEAPANTAVQPDAAAAQVLANAAAAKALAEAQTSKAQSLIDQARKLLGENKWSEALASLNQLSGQTLTPEQQALVQSLTGQAQKSGEAAAKAKAAAEATKAVGGLLPNK